MKKNYSIWLWLLALSCFFAGCKKEREDTLPPATQIGAGTFGCKINGRVYVPKGSSSTGRPNPHMQYDIGFNGQSYLLIDARKFINGTSSSEGSIIISFSNVNHLGNYTYPLDFTFSAGWAPVLGNCDTPAFDTTIVNLGNGNITRHDVANRIVSGTFDFKYKTKLCDTVFVTDGRFDIKF